MHGADEVGFTEAEVVASLTRGGRQPLLAFLSGGYAYTWDPEHAHLAKFGHLDRRKDRACRSYLTARG